MIKPVAVTVDSPADFSKELISQYNITVVPLLVILEEKSYLDGIDIIPQDIFDAYDKKRILPTTSAVSISSYQNVFSSLTKKGMSVIHISLSSKISSTYQNAVLAASEMEDVFVVDSLSLCTGMALLTIKACNMRDEGMEAKNIVKNLEAIRSKVRVSFIIDKLDFLAKGGRCSALTSFGANILGIKPAIQMTDGMLDIGKKYRGKLDQVRLQYIEDEIIQEKNNIDLECAFLAHTGVDESEMLAARDFVLERLPFKKIHIVRAGCTITTHCGQNCFAFMFMNK